MARTDIKILFPAHFRKVWQALLVTCLKCAETKLLQWCVPNLLTWHDAVLDVVLIAMYAHVRYVGLSALPLYICMHGSVISVVVTLSAFVLGFLLDKAKCSKKLGIVTLITFVLSLTVPSLYALASSGLAWRHLYTSRPGWICAAGARDFSLRADILCCLLHLALVLVEGSRGSDEV